MINDINRLPHSGHKQVVLVKELGTVKGVPNSTTSLISQGHICSLQVVDFSFQLLIPTSQIIHPGLKTGVLLPPLFLSNVQLFQGQSEPFIPIIMDLLYPFCDSTEES